MYTYRICKTSYANDLSGQGAKLYGGRWNRPGVAVLYTSFARSLAILELLVHFDSKAALNNDFTMLKLFIPDESLVTLGFNSLPKDGVKINDPRLWSITDDLFSKGAFCIKVPSMIVKEESNYLINPVHPLFLKVRIEATERIDLDNRLFLS